MAWCRCCGRALTDPLSVELQIGPVCRVRRKEAELMDRQSSLFGDRAIYTWSDDGLVVAIVDQDAGKSVTNDAQQVVADLVRSGVPVDRRVLIYRDTMGIWDRMLTHDGQFTGFQAVNERDAATARGKALEAAHAR